MHPINTIRIITIHINAECISTRRSRNSIITITISPVGIGIRTNKQIYIISDSIDFRKTFLSQQFIYQTKHHDIPRRFITMNCGCEQYLWFSDINIIINPNYQQLTTTFQSTKFYQRAFLGIRFRIFPQHRFIHLIRRIFVPFILATIFTIIHLMTFRHRRRN